MEKCSTARATAFHRRVNAPLLALLIAALVAGCGAAPTPGPQGSDPGALTISSVSASDRELPQGGTYVFDPKSQVKNDPRLNPFKMDAMVRAALARSMARRGFTPAEGVIPDLVVAYTAAVGAALDDAALDELFGISSATLGGDSSSRSYEAGTLVVDLYDPFLRRTLWRGALQGVVTFDLPDDVRQQRLNLAIEQLMQRFRKV